MGGGIDSSGTRLYLKRKDMHLAEGAETRRNYRKPKAFGCSSVPLIFDSFLPLGVFFNSLSHGGTEEHGDTDER
jgi:hypothetical protein